jgi:hypothetical protein
LPASDGRAGIQGPAHKAGGVEQAMGRAADMKGIEVARAHQFTIDMVFSRIQGEGHTRNKTAASADLIPTQEHTGTPPTARSGMSSKQPLPAVVIIDDDSNDDDDVHQPYELNTTSKNGDDDEWHHPNDDDESNCPNDDHIAVDVVAVDDDRNDEIISELRKDGPKIAFGGKTSLATGNAAEARPAERSGSSNMVRCPVCAAVVALIDINTHMDAVCLG